MSIHRYWFDLKNIKKPGAHECAKPLVERLRGIGLSLQLGETFDDVTGTQPVKPANCDSVEIVNRSWRNRDVHRHSAVDCIVGCAAGNDLHVVITTCFVICLETTRNVLDSRICVRPLQQIEHLSTQGFGAVYRAPIKRNETKEILAPLMDRDDYVHFPALPVKGVTRCIDLCIQKTFGQIETMHQVRSFLHVSRDKRKNFLRP